ncbi:MAG: hypothetical protein Q9170_002386 [Blastenia crenularia]
MAPSCNHAILKCDHLQAWGRFPNESWTPSTLSYECAAYEKRMEALKRDRQTWLPEGVSDDDTVCDQEEADAAMNNVLTRKSLPSPPYTPDPGLGLPAYTLQRSQHPPSPIATPKQRSSPPSADKVRLRVPLKASRRSRKAQPIARPLRRPITRSLRSFEFGSLYNTKGLVVVASLKGEARVVRFDQYLVSLPPR